MKKFIILMLIFLAACTEKAAKNLTIELIANSQLNTVINDAKLSCSEIHLGMPTSPKSWCNAKPLNLPIEIRDGKAKLLFLLDPAPMEFMFDKEPSPLYDSPLLYIKTNDHEYLVGTENAKYDQWIVRPSIK